MHRRKFIRCCSFVFPAVYLNNKFGDKMLNDKGKIVFSRFIDDDNYIRKLGDTVLRKSAKLGCSYSDFRVSSIRTQRIASRENTILGISDDEDFGFSVRVLKDGVWGFAASSTVTETEAEKITVIAHELAEESKQIQKRRVELVPVPAYIDLWRTPIKTDPFDISVDDKVNLLFKINQKALDLGADYCSSFVWFAKEMKWFMSSEGSFIKQEIDRTWPQFDLTVVDKTTGKFENRTSLTAPVGKGYEYIEEYDFIADIEKAVEETKMKLKAESVKPGYKDIILDPTHLWLTIHETCGHPSELDRALGFETNYAGTSFLTTDKLGKLKYGSEIVNLVADRTQKDGLATRGYDDDGVKTTQWHIIKNGLFVGYQTTREMASYIGETVSNGCAYSDSWSHYPIQRMPNISLSPGANRLGLKDLITETEDGIYICGDGSWSIDMQRYNFQFTGQVFYEIKNGQITKLLRDVAYQGNTVVFWNSCDKICDASEYKLGGSFFCGKGEPGQVSPVSHGSSPARFKKIKILNTSKESKR
jgi:TldD protein